MRARLPSIAKGPIQFECGTDTTVGAIPGPQSRDSGRASKCQHRSGDTPTFQQVTVAPTAAARDDEGADRKPGGSSGQGA
jgi:hypothetical protein